MHYHAACALYGLKRLCGICTNALYSMSHDRFSEPRVLGHGHPVLSLSCDELKGQR